MRISDWSSDVCSSDLLAVTGTLTFPGDRLDQKGNGVGHASCDRRSAESLCPSRRVADFRRSEEHTSELQSLMRISYAVFCLKKKKPTMIYRDQHHRR